MRPWAGSWTCHLESADPGTEAGKRPGLPGWLACEGHKPLADAGDGFAGFADGAAEPDGHVACDQREAVQSSCDVGAVQGG